VKKRNALTPALSRVRERGRLVGEIWLLVVEEEPSPYPLPEYRERGRESSPGRGEEGEESTPTVRVWGLSS
jgi:hypothetical protein